MGTLSELSTSRESAQLKWTQNWCFQLPYPSFYVFSILERHSAVTSAQPMITLILTVMTPSSRILKDKTKRTPNSKEIAKTPEPISAGKYIRMCGATKGLSVPVDLSPTKRIRPTATRPCWKSTTPSSASVSRGKTATRLICWGCQWWESWQQWSSHSYTSIWQAYCAQPHHRQPLTVTGHSYYTVTGHSYYTVTGHSHHLVTKWATVVQLGCEL